MNLNLFSGFLRSSNAFGNRPALEVDGQVLTYSQLESTAKSLAATLVRHSMSPDPRLTAVFAHRSATAFVGVLGALLRGHGYVPLNTTFPVERTKSMLMRAGCRELVVDTQSEAYLKDLLLEIADPLLVVLPESTDSSSLTELFPQHRFITRTGLLPADSWSPPSVDADEVAYLLFTSGSTGIPKGVMVTHRNVRHYIDFITSRFDINETDRFSQTFEHTFDLSAADMFVAWEKGACLCCPSRKQLIKPGKFIVESRLTVWFSVPSMVTFMKKLGELKPGQYPGLRLSMFCGEALPFTIAKAWAAAAPNSIVENLYGPTELTIACTYYRMDPNLSEADCEQGCVPIGFPFPGMIPLIVNESLQEVGEGESGELLMTGPQMSRGYWNDPEKTSAAFVRPPNATDTYYRTGDRVRRASLGGPLLYLGRADQQIKILGHRVELGEVEAAVRDVSGSSEVVAIGWPVNAGGADGVEVFLQGEFADTSKLKEPLAARLPFYMLPRRIHVMKQIPLNSNGKLDRKALTRILEQQIS